MRFVMMGALLAGCAACSVAASAPALPASVSAPASMQVGRVQSPRPNAKRELEYRQLKDAIEKAQQFHDQFDAISGSPP